jgi:hypothetical protein
LGIDRCEDRRKKWSRGRQAAVFIHAAGLDGKAVEVKWRREISVFISFLEGYLYGRGFERFRDQDISTADIDFTNVLKAGHSPMLLLEATRMIGSHAQSCQQILGNVAAKKSAEFQKREALPIPRGGDVGTCLLD